MRTFTRVCYGLCLGLLGTSSVACTAAPVDAAAKDNVESQAAGLQGAKHAKWEPRPGRASRGAAARQEHAGSCHTPGPGAGSGGAGSGGPGSSSDGRSGGASADDCALEILDGSLSAECSTLFGYFYTYVDEGYSTIEPGEYGAGTTGSVCASGSAAQVLDDQYDTYWGAGVGVILDPEIDGVSTPYDAAGESVEGFAFSLSGAPTGGAIRFDVHTQADDTIYCTPFVYVQEGYNEVLFADLVSDCWDPGSVMPDISQISNLQWQVVTNTQGAFDFDFCVSNLVALK